MTTLNWRVLSPNTLRAYEQAAKDFETVTGRRVEHADSESIAAWQASMTGRNLSVNTIRKRLSVVSLLSGVKVELPKPEKAQSVRTLTADQVRKVMSIVMDPTDRMLLMKLLTLGMQARTITATTETFAAHFVGNTQAELSAQQASRKIRRYARRAGLNEQQVSLRVWCQSGRRLMDILGTMEFLKLVETHDTSPAVEWKPLHGIGRRSKSVSV